VRPGVNIEIIDPGNVATQETFSRFSDERAEDPLGLEIVQRSYAFNSALYDDFIILHYVLKNTNASSMSAIYIGLYFDWDIPAYDNAGGWDAGGNFAWMAYNNGSALSNYRGVKVVHGTTATAFTATAFPLIYYPSDQFPQGDGFTEQEKYSSLTDGFSSSTTYMDAQTDLIQLVSVGPITLHVGQVDTVAFALLAGNSLADFTAAAAEAQVAYDGVITDVEDVDGVGLPETFSLSQNYPNPFNPTTQINFEIPVRSHVTLTVYNLLGQKVTTLVDKEMSAGRYVADWNSTSDGESKVASGIYFYKLEAGDFIETKKMMLLK